MTSAACTAESELQIWERVFVPQHITPDQARYLLDLRFRQSDVHRIHALSVQAQEGVLNPDEKAELERYIHVGHILSILKARVRGRLKEMHRLSEDNAQTRNR